MYLTRTHRDGSFATAVKLGRESWPLAGCPMDGGDVAFDANGELVTIWRRDTDVFLARPGQADSDWARAGILCSPLAGLRLTEHGPRAMLSSCKI
jgi:hypothetical protein